MRLYFLKRLGVMLTTLFIIATVTFFLMKLLPGTPYSNPDKLSEQQLASLNQKYGLDQPLPVQYARYLGNLVQGDWGVSFQFKGRLVTDIIFKRIGPSVLIGFQAMLIGSIVGLGLGILSALRQNSLFDLGAVTMAVLGMSIPSFVFAALLQYYVGVKLGWLPPGLWEDYSYSILPSLALSVTVIAAVARFIRTEMLEVLTQDYILSARAKGISEFAVVWKHVVRNSLIPVVTMLGPMAVSIMTGTLVIEKIFSVPGLGEQFILSIMVNDYSVIMGITLFYSTLFILVVLLVDMIYGILDPRIREKWGEST
ncbi:MULTISPECIES: ABC transporter permease [Brevibacillus]|jgi:ABC-type dipeptide/oligopeptide/nickel transport systems, permease components|uniref:ABC transporter permease n=1 Tax=Brevibacillus TaxID=55080 RepID=UPI00156AAE1A|nr:MULTISPECIES: ABC transporter permease [Brevibacillus]MDH6349310.1 oligopeptide transport system permease protein [Brevibacillus sp. 1238]MDR5001323.1 ABC transporter permease [Brevibacillus parabrevis]MED2257419.1 ABC transporter permease [Brevibacillus parabrevis]UED71538.1 ABC transporter permease [Brevibacillus sp. HD3.3A]